MKKSYYRTPAPYFFLYKKGGPKGYIALQKKRYYSARYGKSVTINIGYLSDGATDAIDIISFSWWIHDRLCDTGKWDDGTRLTNLQASFVLYDILRDEGRFIRDFWWLLSTFLFGGGEARKNGLFKLNLKGEKNMKKTAILLLVGMLSGCAHGDITKKQIDPKTQVETTCSASYTSVFKDMQDVSVKGCDAEGGATTGKDNLSNALMQGFASWLAAGAK